jgi:hypothetical protein
MLHLVGCTLDIYSCDARKYERPKSRLPSMSNIFTALTFDKVKSSFLQGYINSYCSIHAIEHNKNLIVSNESEDTCKKSLAAYFKTILELSAEVKMIA